MPQKTDTPETVTKRLRSSTAAKVHGSASWHGMTCECAHRLHLVEASATALLLVSCTHRGSGQGCPATFLLRFLGRIATGGRGGRRARSTYVLSRIHPRYVRGLLAHNDNDPLQQSAVAQFIGLCSS